MSVSITPKTRLPELKEFYASNLATSATVALEKPSDSDMVSVESRGTYLVEKFASAAKRLWVWPFVVALSDKQAQEIPELAELDDYIKCWLSIKKRSISELQAEFPMRERQVDRLMRQLVAAEEVLEDTESFPLEPVPPAAPGDDPDEHARLVREYEESVLLKESSVKAAAEAVDSVFKHWNDAATTLRKDKQTIADWTEEARQGAEKQHSEDSDALTRAKNAMAMLKKFLLLLLDLVPEAVDVAKQMGEDGLDPLAEDDLRGVYANLAKRYKDSGELGVTTQILARFNERQGDKSLAAFMRGIDEFYQVMVRLGVLTISIGDLAAILGLAGMNDQPREDFLQSETTLALTLENLGEPLEDFDDGVTVASTKRERKTMLSKLRAYAAKEAERQLRSSQLRNGGVSGTTAGGVSGGVSSGGNAGASNSSGGANNRTARDLKKERKEAQQVFAAVVLREKKNACADYVRSGTCARGSACTKSHEYTCALPKQQPSAPKTPVQQQASSGVGGGGQGGAPVERRKGVCDRWARSGECRFGDQCRFEHSAQRQLTTSTSAGPSKEAAKLFSVGTTSAHIEYESDEEVVDVVLVGREQDAVCMAVTTAQPPRILGWDTMASVHVAQDLSVIPGAKLLPVGKRAHGVGGSKSITHSGPSPLFGGVDMVYIEGGGTPNLLSLGRALQVDQKTGLEGGALFSARGAVRFRVTEEAKLKLAHLYDWLSTEGLIEGTAEMRNNVYEETFGCAALSEPRRMRFEVGDTDEDVCVARISMFANRVRLDRVDDAIDMLVAAGLNQAAFGGPLRGLPEGITREKVAHYFEHIGKDSESLEADITSAPLRQPVDYETEVPEAAGSMLFIDNIDPPFSRMKQPEGPVVEGKKQRMVLKVVPSIGGYKDAVIGVDGKSGYAFIVGRMTKANPHKVVEGFVERWTGRWGRLAVIKADKEFVTQETVALAAKTGCKLRQSVPGDHRRTTGKVEGAVRWIQDLAQSFMNRLRVLVRDDVITEEQSRSLWFHALQQAATAWNLRPSLGDDQVTRYQEGTGDVANLSNLVMLPFGMQIIGKNLQGGADGRGSKGLYVGPSHTVRGGLITFNPETNRLSVKYSFLPVINAQRATPTKQLAAAKAIYGKLQDVPEESSPEMSSGTATSQAESQGALESVSVQSSTPIEVITKDQTVLEREEEPGVSVMDQEASTVGSGGITDLLQLCGKPSPEAIGDGSPRGGVLQRPNGAAVVSEYGTRSKSKVMAVSDRPPKPPLPSRKVCLTDPRWRAARAREGQKLMEMNTFVDLPVDERGRCVRPDGAIVLRLLCVNEYKWKVDPETRQECWLECTRFVCDGSTDKRSDGLYAECPDRTLLFLMVSIGASLGESVTGSDVERAYLNADSIDRNIVIVAPDDMGGVPRESLLNKGLYGSRGGALSWQVWIDQRMSELAYRKLDVARGVYVKRLQSGELLRAYRHSDDFRMSSLDEEGRRGEERAMRELVKMAEFEPVKRFLGCTFEYIDAVTGEPSLSGTIVLVRQTEKILEMGVKFHHLHVQYNPRNRTRASSCPLNAIQEDAELLERGLADLVSAASKMEYMSLVGCVGWVVGSTRPDAKFAYFLLARRTAAPREWDMFLAVWVMDYLVGTVDAPLVLGGPIIDPEVMADASHATLGERRSIGGHIATTGPGSGAIYAQVHASKCAVDSIFEAELIAGCRGCDTAVYLTSLCDELEYTVPRCRRVRVDNEAEIEWVKGDVSNKRSKHVDIKFYRARHLQANGDVSLEYVSTEENVADILTKTMPVKLFRKMAGKILGHDLVRNVPGVKGLIE